MSIHAMNGVWKLAPYDGDTLLTLLAMADWSDDEGVCWPSIKKLAEKTRQSERNAQYCLDRLKIAGAVTVLSPGGGRGNPAKYRINLAIFAPIKTPKGANGSKERVQSTQGKGANSDTPIRKEPSVEPPRGTVREKAPPVSPEEDAKELPVIALAQKVAAEVCLTGPGVIQAIANAIEFCIRHDVITADGAVEFLIAHALAEIKAGGIVDRFWFESRKWRKARASPVSDFAAEGRSNDPTQADIDDYRRKHGSAASKI